MKSRESGKAMSFSQAVIGHSAKKSSRPTTRAKAVSSTGMVNKSPRKPMAPKLRGKRVY